MLIKKRIFNTFMRQKQQVRHKGAIRHTNAQLWYKSRRQRYMGFLVSTIGWFSVVMLGLCGAMLFYILAILLLSL
jgi:hypothetical protein